MLCRVSPAQHSLKDRFLKNGSSELFHTQDYTSLDPQLYTHQESLKVHRKIEEKIEGQRCIHTDSFHFS